MLRSLLTCDYALASSHALAPYLPPELLAYNDRQSKHFKSPQVPPNFQRTISRDIQT